MEKRNTVCSVHDLQDNSQDMCSCGKTTSSDQKSSSTVCTNATAGQPRDTSLDTPPVIESASATTSSKNHTDSAPFVIFAISIVILFFTYPILSSFTRSSIARLQQWTTRSYPAEKDYLRRYRYCPYQNNKVAPERFSSAVLPLSQDDFYE